MNCRFPLTISGTCCILVMVPRGSRNSDPKETQRTRNNDLSGGIKKRPAGSEERSGEFEGRSCGEPVCSGASIPRGSPRRGATSKQDLRERCQRRRQRVAFVESPGKFSREAGRGERSGPGWRIGVGRSKKQIGSVDSIAVSRKRQSRCGRAKGRLEISASLQRRRLGNQLRVKAFGWQIP